MNLPHIIQRWNISSPEQLVARASERMPFWISLLLVVALGYELARLVWLLAPMPETAPWSPPPLDNATGITANATNDYAALVNAHLFGEPGAQVQPEPGADAADAPETQLNLQLRGAIAAEDPRYAHAIIADGSGVEKVYFVKDTVPGGAILHRVQADRVILNRGGTLEALVLPKETPAGGSAGAAVNPLAARGTPGSRRAGPPSVQEVVSQNPAAITEIIRPQPYMPSGQLKGYRVYPGRDRERFVALGLQPGDLVTEINGMALNNPAEAMEIFRSIGDTTEVSVTIEREGQAQSLTLDTSQLAAAAGGGTQ